MAVLSIGEARKHLNLSDFKYDDELAGVVAAAEASISRWIGPLEPTVTTSQVVATSDGLLLPVTPVISLTSVTNYAGTVITGLVVDSDSGLITYSGNSSQSFGTGEYTVVYSAGRASVPADLLLAVKELSRHLWESQRGPARVPNPLAPEGPTAAPGAGYLMPYRVQELLVPFMQTAVG